MLKALEILYQYQQVDKVVSGYMGEKLVKDRWKDVYVKYEETYEGYCIHANKKDIDGTDK